MKEMMTIRPPGFTMRGAAFEQRVELFLLPIDHHSQRHESASRGMQRSRSRCGPFHYTRQVQCAPNGPRSNDCSGYLPRSPFFAELVEPVGDCLFGTVVQQIGRCRALALIHAHIQRPFRLK